MINPKVKVKVSIAGKEIGEFWLWEIADKLSAKSFTPSDHYWQEGMSDWRLISEIEKDAKYAKINNDHEEKLAQQKIKQDAYEKRLKEEAESERAKRIEWQKEMVKKKFTCHTCQETFPYYDRVDTKWGLWVLVMVGVVITILNTAVLVAPVAIVLALLTFAICGFLSGLTQPHCPHCKSTNISRPPKE